MIILGLRWLTFFGCLVLFLARGAETAPAPDFNEVYGLIQKHLAGSTPQDLDRTAVEALVSALSPKVSLAGRPGVVTESGRLVIQTNLFDGPICYLRVSQIGTGLAGALQDGWKGHGTNQLKGLVLDLRYAGGTDYASAADAAGLLIKNEQPLMDWGNGVVISKPNPQALTVPVAILVNRKTAGAAEVLAAVLREAGAGLILGSRTAGQAMIAQEYPLNNGQQLRIATGPIRLGDGSAISPEGLQPDITVEVSAPDEKAYYADAFKEISRTNRIAGSGLSAARDTTNRVRRVRLNEAELVRERRDGLDSELPATANSQAEPPLVHDPVLARALDLLKGLALVRQSRF